jgi:TonB-linked SusC/RagA family outer membrane protein
MQPPNRSLLSLLTGTEPMTGARHRAFQTHAWRLLAAASLLLLAALPSKVTAQGVITGRVVNAETAAPLATAQVYIEGTNFGALTDGEGVYRIVNAPAGTHVVRATLIGYGPVMVTVTLTDGGAVTADFDLTPSFLQLDGVFVSVTGEQRKREVGNAVGSIDAATLVDVAPVNNMADLLMGRVAGVQVLGSSGTTGAGSRVRIRGSSSFSLSNDPLVYVDGVRIDTGMSQLLGSADQDASRLDDFTPEQIESVEIVKGPAATTLYGTEAANGVILITTKRGQPGDTRWNAWIEAGVVQDPTDYPLNWTGLDVNTPPFAAQCLLALQDLGLCSQTGVESFQGLNDPDLTPIDNGDRVQYGLSVQGGSDRISYYIAGAIEDETGPYSLPQGDRETLQGLGFPVTEEVEHPSQLERRSLRVNLSSQLTDDALLEMRAGYVDSHLAYTPNDNAVWGLMGNALFGGSSPDNAWLGLSPGQIFALGYEQDVERFTLGSTLSMDPLPWLTLRGTAGVDFTNRHDVEAVPRAIGVQSPFDLGFRESDYANTSQYTLDLVATGTFRVSPGVESRTSVGGQYFRNYFRGTFASGIDIPSGASSLGAAAETIASEFHIEDKTLGIFIDEQVAINDRLFVNVGVRADDNSAFGRDFDLIAYPKAGVSWMASEESFFPELDFVDQLRLRAAWGQSGLQPGTDDAIRTLDARAVVSPGDVPISGLQIESVGNALLEPERSSEIEVGLDADLLSGRLGVELTYYDKNTDGALVSVPLAPSAGASSTRWANLGEVENKGWEGAIRATVLEASRVTWDVTLSGSINKNELISLGEGTDPIGAVGTRFVPGYPLGGQWDFQLESWNDANGDGIIGMSEITVGDTLAYAGPGMPEKELTISTVVTFLERFRLYGSLDYRGDYVAANYTELLRCQIFVNCRGVVDPTSSLEEQARAVAAVFHPSGTAWGFLEKTHFWKLRELSLSYSLPESLLARIGSRSATLTLTGRNLATWTDYSGLDPEINFDGSGDNFGVTELLTQPPVRYFSLRLNIGF